MGNDRQRLGEFDIVERWGGKTPPWLVQIIFGVGCTGAAILARVVVDVFAPTAGPFSLIYPATLISALYGRLTAGAVTCVTGFLFAWYFVLPETHSFHFADPNDGPRTLVNGLSVAVILVFAQVFRRAVRRAVRERDQEIANRDLLLRELDHRTKNNFTIVTSLLELQKRRQTSAAARDALAAAAARVHSFAAAHQSLYQSGGHLRDVAMADYLRQLAEDVVDAFFLAGRVQLEMAIDQIDMPRDQAVSIGVVLNEVITNAAKHAFGPEDTGTVRVEFRAEGRAWRLVVSDDGQGAAAPAKARSGLGSSLIEAFAARAGGKVSVERAGRGTCVTVEGPLIQQEAG